MRMEQVYGILNTITNEILGDSVVVTEDLSNIVDVGRAYEDMENGLDNFVRALNDHIGRVVFVERVYRGRVPSVLMDGWEYGSIMEKIRGSLPSAVENESWLLEDGASYDPNIFYKPDVDVKFFNKRVTFEIDMSFVERQVKSAFSSAMQMNGLMSMIRTNIENSMTIKIDSLVMRTLNAAIGETLYDEYNSGVYTGGSGVRAVNLLYLYNENVNTGSDISASEALHDESFMRFATMTMKNYFSRMSVISKLFNIGNTEKFTPSDMLHVVMLDVFKNAVETYLYDGLNQFNTDKLKLPENIETIPYWQGSGTDYGWDSVSAINIVTPSGHGVNASGILAVAFDRDCLGVSNVSRRVTTNYNPKAEFWSEFHKFDAGYFLDTDENCVVFFVA